MAPTTQKSSFEAIEAYGIARKAFPRENMDAKPELAWLLGFLRNSARGVQVGLAAQIVGVSRQTISKRVDAGDIRVVNLGSRTRLLDVDDVLDLAEEVDQLRTLGKDKHLVTLALHRLKQSSEHALSGSIQDGLHAMQTGALVKMTLDDLDDDD